MTTMLQTFYQSFLAPKASTEDARRRELILNILLAGAIGLSSVAFALTLVQVVFLGRLDAGASLFLTFIAVSVFSFFFVLSRFGMQILAMYLFVGMFVILATYPTLTWGILLPQGILTYSLIIVMSGVLLGSRIAFWMAGFMAAFLIGIVYMGNAGWVNFDTSWALLQGNYKDAITFGVTFIVIALVSWLSNREIQHSLERALESERELTKERNSLDRKVKERTKLLEKAQMEKMLDLQRFAEFGRLSSTLLHELANPLTAVSLNLEQLKGKNRSKLISHAQEGIAHMEQYVEAARRQLRNQSEIRLFDVAAEVQRVSGFLEAKARSRNVEIKLDLIDNMNLKGDSIRFNHVISNLLSNAIDAYDSVEDKKAKVISVTMRHLDNEVEITVQDYGRGVSADQLPHLFEPFYTTKESLRGTGIGLAITKQAVEEAFKGTIGALSDKKSGTRFVVRLPLI